MLFNYCSVCLLILVCFSKFANSTQEIPPIHSHRRFPQNMYRVAPLISKRVFLDCVWPYNSENPEKIFSFSPKIEDFFSKCEIFTQICRNSLRHENNIDKCCLTILVYVFLFLFVFQSL